MTSTNDSRKRRRVTIEEVTEVPSERGRVDGRDREEDQGLSSGPRNEELGNDAGDDASTRHVGEVTGEDRGASRRANLGMADAFARMLPKPRPNLFDAGFVGFGGSASQRLEDTSFYNQVVQVRSRIMKLVAELPQHERLDLGIDEMGWSNDPNRVSGPVQAIPPGLWTSTAVVGLFSGTIQHREALIDFIKHALSLERAERLSRTGEAVYVHMPVNSSVAEPDLKAIAAAAKSAYTAAPSPAPMKRSHRAMHSEAAAARKVGDDLTKSTEPPPLVCDICQCEGTHSTGRCAMVTSDKHGDTNTDPFCGCSSSRAHDRYGKRTHGLQRRQDSGAPRVQIVCAKLAALWEQRQLEPLFQKFVVERRRMGPLLMYTKHFCFIRLAIAYSYAFCGGEVPEELEGIWPYTKADAIKHKNRLRRFYEIGMENMPAGELEGLSMADIRARYDTRGGIPPQYRYDT